MGVDTGHELWRARIDRRRFLLGAGAVGGITLGGSLLAACGGNSPTPIRTTTNLGTITTQLEFVKDVTFAGWYLADRHGYYSDAGLTSRLLTGGPSVPNYEGIVAAGAAQIGLDDIDSIISARAQGVDLVALGAQYEQSPSGIMSLSKKPVRTPQDLVGIRIGAQPGAVVGVKGIFMLNNLPLDQMRIVNVGRSPQPLIDGVVDCFTCYVTSQPITVKQKGLDPVTVTFGDLGSPGPANVLFAKRDYLKANRKVVVEYLKATIKGWELNEKDTSEAVQLVVNTVSPDLGLDASQQLAENNLQLPLMRWKTTKTKGLFWLDPAAIAGPVYAAMKATGHTNLPPVDEWLDLSFLSDAYAGKASI